MYNEPIKTNIMADGKKIQDLRMEPATNGVIISYTEKKEKAGSKNTYDNCSYDYKKEVYDFDTNEKGESASESKKDLDGAFERFKELWKEAHMTSM